jgi:hypothetical protein
MGLVVGVLCAIITWRIPPIFLRFLVFLDFSRRFLPSRHAHYLEHMGFEPILGSAGLDTVPY